jgi:hypothetical protein
MVTLLPAATLVVDVPVPEAPTLQRRSFDARSVVVNEMFLLGREGKKSEVSECVPVTGEL